MEASDELQMWKRIKDSLESVPENYQSRNYTSFLREVEFKIDEIYEQLNPQGSDVE